MSGVGSRNVWGRLAWGVLLAGLLLAPGTALGQSLKDDIIGAWRLVSNVSEQGGVKTHTFGEKPVGLTIYDRSGYVTQLLFKPGLPKFAVPNRLKGTDQPKHCSCPHGTTAPSGAPPIALQLGVHVTRR